MSTARFPRNSAPMCPGCGLYPAVNDGVHRTDCTAEQTPEAEALANIAAVFGPHLTPNSRRELQDLIDGAQ